MIGTYLPMFLMIAVAIILALLFFTGATFLGGKLNKTPEKMMPFECGSRDAPARSHVKLTREVLPDRDPVRRLRHRGGLHLPVGGRCSRASGWVGLRRRCSASSPSLVVALVYVWKKGALEWES